MAYTIDAFHGGGGSFSTKKAALARAKQLREANKYAGNKGPVRVVKLKNPSVPKNKFIKCKAVKINSNGSISIKR